MFSCDNHARNNIVTTDNKRKKKSGSKQEQKELKSTIVFFFSLHKVSFVQRMRAVYVFLRVSGPP